VAEADVVRRPKEGFRIASLPSVGLEAPMDATLKLARTVGVPIEKPGDSTGTFKELSIA